MAIRRLIVQNHAGHLAPSFSRANGNGSSSRFLVLPPQILSDLLGYFPSLDTRDIVSIYSHLDQYGSRFNSPGWDILYRFFFFKLFPALRAS